MADWQIEAVTVYRLSRDGQVIRTSDGRPADFDTEEHAQHVAANWDTYRAPTFAELRGLSDVQLRKKAGVSA